MLQQFMQLSQCHFCIPPSSDIFGIVCFITRQQKRSDAGNAKMLLRTYNIWLKELSIAGKTQTANKRNPLKGNVGTLILPAAMAW